METKVFKLPCAHCGVEVERQVFIHNAVCFDCKVKRTKEYSKIQREKAQMA